MASAFTKAVKDEVLSHIDKIEKIDLSKANLNRMQIKKDLRIKFIEKGLIYDPENGHHLELRFNNIDDANITLQELSLYGIAGKISFNEKKKCYLVYISDEKTVMDLLKILGASKSLKTYEKKVRDKKRISDVNRMVNFETANIKKVANASLNQLDDIKKLLKKYKFESIDKDLQVVIKARRKYKDISLTELAEKIGNMSKSKINHAFIKMRKMIGE